MKINIFKGFSLRILFNVDIFMSPFLIMAIILYIVKSDYILLTVVIILYILISAIVLFISYVFLEKNIIINIFILKKNHFC